MCGKVVDLVRDEDPNKEVRGIELVVALSYATFPDRLTNATRECLLWAMQYKRQFPNAILAFTNCTHSRFKECAEREYEIKLGLLGDEPHISAPACNNSILEAEGIRDAIGFSPHRILIVCEAMHSRSVRY